MYNLKNDCLGGEKMPIILMQLFRAASFSTIHLLFSDKISNLDLHNIYYLYFSFFMQIVEYFFIISGELFIMFRQKNVLILFQEGKTSLGISMSF